MNWKKLSIAGVFVLISSTAVTLVIVFSRPTPLPPALPSNPRSENQQCPLEDSARKPIMAGFTPSVYFATTRNGIWAYSQETGTARRILECYAGLEGLTYDPNHDHLYFSSFITIYRMKITGPGMSYVSVHQNEEYAVIGGMAFDDIAGNVYGVGSQGVVFVCKAEPQGPLLCTTVLEYEGSLGTIAVNPHQGEMFFTQDSKVRGRIVKADLDGLNIQEIFGDKLLSPLGIAVDFRTSKVVWADGAGVGKIQTCTPQGTELETVLLTTVLNRPWGIAVHEDKIYWGSLHGATITSVRGSGENVTSLYRGNACIYSLVLPTKHAGARRNHCSNVTCAGICVLTPTNARCVPL